MWYMWRIEDVDVAVLGVSESGCLDTVWFTGHREFEICSIDFTLMHIVNG